MPDLNAAIRDIPMPVRIKRQPVSDKGFPIPRFVAWVRNGLQTERFAEGAAPDFRVIDSQFMANAFRRKWCWLCGEPLGEHQVFVIGPMCVVNRVTMEPPSHRDCAEYAAKACPFLSQPRMRRNEKDLDDYAEKIRETPGIMIARNPGVVALVEVDRYARFSVANGGLVRLGRPTRIDWWCEGRQATRAEVERSIETGYPALLKQAEIDGPEAVHELALMRQNADRYLPAA